MIILKKAKSRSAKRLKTNEKIQAQLQKAQCLPLKKIFSTAVNKFLDEFASAFLGIREFVTRKTSLNVGTAEKEILTRSGVRTHADNTSIRT